MDNLRNTSFDITEKSLLLTQVYEELSKKELNLSYVGELVSLKNECKLINNYRYFYLFNILLTDLYINYNQLDNALDLMLKDYNEIDKEKYTDLYILILDRIIYVYITKQFYQSALRYANEKKMYFDNPTTDEVNRWYLEMAYIHEALGEKNRSLIELTAILENNPDDNTRLVALSNITKLFIDAGNINEALINLADCFTLCFKLDDKESENYCNYLRAKIYRLQKSYKKASKFFEDLFKSLDNLDNDNFNYLNEYLVLLQDTREYGAAKKVCEKFIDQVEKSKDLYNKKMFYENYLRIRANLATGSKNNFDYLFDIINDLDKQISKNKDLRINEIKDVEVSFEIKNKSKETYDKVSYVVDLLKKITGENIRDYLMKFSKLLEKECGVSEVQYYVFSRDYDYIVPTQRKEMTLLEALNYKVNRFYERKISYDDLNNSVIEMLFNGNNNITVDLSSNLSDFIDPISHLSHKDLKNKYANIFALYNNDNLYGAVNYISKYIDIISDVNALILQIATSILEKQLLKMFGDINLNEQRGLISTALSGIDINIIYYNKVTGKIYLPEAIKQLIGLQTTEISFEEYEKLIDKSDIIKYRDKKIAIENNKEYQVSYHLNIENNIFSILEQARPYNDNYYYGTISNADITKSITTIEGNDKVYGSDDLLNEINDLKVRALNDKIAFDVLGVKADLKNLSLNEKEQILKEVYQNIKSIYNTKVYLLNSLFVVISYDKLLNRRFKEVKKLIVKNYQIESNIVKPEFRLITMSYPKQFLNVEEMIELMEFAIEKTEEETLEKSSFAKYLTYKAVNDCAYNALCSSKIDFIFSKVVQNGEEIGSFAIPNIKGLSSEDSLLLLSEKIKIQLEEKQLETIIDENINNVFLNVGMQSIKNLILNNDENYLKKVKLNLLLEDFTDDYISVIKDIKRLGHNVILSGDDLNKITIELINKNLIDGVYNISIENEQFYKYLNPNVFLLTSCEKTNLNINNIVYIVG